MGKRFGRATGVLAIFAIHGGREYSSRSQADIKWIKNEPKNFDSWLSYGKVLHGLGRNEEAKKALEKALSYNPLDANALFTMSNVLALVGDGANLKKVREALELVDPQGVAEGKCNMAC